MNKIMTPKYNKIVLSIPYQSESIQNDISTLNDSLGAIPIVSFTQAISGESVAEIYDEHRGRLNELLGADDLLVNYYTFSDELAGRDDIDICISYYEDKSKPDKETIHNVSIAFFMNYRIRFNKPFCGSIQPRKEIDYKSIMVGINERYCQSEKLHKAILRMCKELQKLIKEFVFYEKPADADDKLWVEWADINGKPFWIDWHKKISGTIEMKSPDEINELPQEVAALIPQWEKEIKRLKSENYDLHYPVKGAHIDFIYGDQLYSLHAEALSSTKVIRQCGYPDGSIREYINTSHELFSGARRMLEKDLKDVGSIYVSYTDFLD